MGFTNLVLSTDEAMVWLADGLEAIPRRILTGFELSVSKAISELQIPVLSCCNRSPFTVISRESTLWVYGMKMVGEENDQLAPLMRSIKLQSRVLKIATGDDHCLLVAQGADATHDTKLYSFGSNAYGQLGIGRPDVKFSCIPILVLLPSKSSIREVAAGSFFSLMILEPGQVFSFGCGAYYRLGVDDDDDDDDDDEEEEKKKEEEEEDDDDDDDEEKGETKGPKRQRRSTKSVPNPSSKPILGSKDRYSPTHVSTLAGIGQWNGVSGTSGAKLCACGTWHAVVVADGTNDVYTWGWGKYGQLGHTAKANDSEFDEMVPFPRRVSQLDHASLLGDNTGDSLDEGGAYTGGGGEGRTNGPNSIAQVTCGSRHTALLAHSGRVVLLGQVR